MNFRTNIDYTSLTRANPKNKNLAKSIFLLVIKDWNLFSENSPDRDQRWNHFLTKLNGFYVSKLTT